MLFEKEQGIFYPFDMIEAEKELVNEGYVLEIVILRSAINIAYWKWRKKFNSQKLL